MKLRILNLHSFFVMKKAVSAGRNLTSLLETTPKNGDGKTPKKGDGKAPKKGDGETGTHR